MVCDDSETAQDFSEELKSLADVHEVRGCSTKDMAKILVYDGLTQLSKTSRGREEVAMQVIRVIEGGRDNPDEED